MEPEVEALLDDPVIRSILVECAQLNIEDSEQWKKMDEDKVRKSDYSFDNERREIRKAFLLGKASILGLPVYEVQFTGDSGIDNYKLADKLHKQFGIKFDPDCEMGAFYFGVTPEIADAVAEELDSLRIEYSRDIPHTPSAPLDIQIGDGAKKFLKKYGDK